MLKHIEVQSLGKYKGVNLYYVRTSDGTQILSFGNYSLTISYKNNKISLYPISYHMAAREALFRACSLGMIKYNQT